LLEDLINGGDISTSSDFEFTSSNLLIFREEVKLEQLTKQEEMEAAQLEQVCAYLEKPIFIYSL
jgi:hypothetical protein